MIRSKQMEEIRGLDKRLRSLGIATMPNLEKHVMRALVSGERPKLKTTAEIAGAAREKMVGNGRYSSDRMLNFADVFASTNGYQGEMNIFRAHEKKRREALGRYEKAAEKILVKALDQDADAAEIVEQLHDAADASGLKALTAPVFGEPGNSDN